MNSRTFPLDTAIPAQTSLREQRRMAISIFEARIILTAFLITFAVARSLVYLMMAHRVPDMYLHVGPERTHVHHLNYGIFLLSFIGAYSILLRPRGVHMSCTAAIYGIAMGLTFDEFGMWYHLSGQYWQQASYEAVVVIGLVFGILALAPEIRKIRARTWVATGVTLISVAIFVVGLRAPFRHALHRWTPGLHHFAVVSPATR